MHTTDGPTFDILHVDTSTASRAAGIIAIADLPELDALRVAATRRIGMGQTTSATGKVTSADARAVSAWRGLILRLTESAGATESHAMLKCITPSFLRLLVQKQGGLAFSCPVTGTYILAPSDTTVDVGSAGDAAAAARARAADARPGLIAATRARLEIAA